MNKSYILFALLLATQVFAGGRRLGLDMGRASAYLTGGDCYVNPGVETGPVVTKYYGLPYGWNQVQERVVIPNVVSQSGNWIVGMRCTDGSDSYNEQVRFAISGLSITVSPLSSSTSRTLVIGDNFRSQGVSDDQYRGFVSTLPTVTSRPVESVREVAATGGASLIPTFPGLQFGNANWASNILKPAVNNDFVNNVLISQTPAFSQGSQVSEDQRRRALQRQYSANQALNQLNSLINTLSSSVGATTSSISRLQSAVESARAVSSQCSNKINDLSSAKTSTQTSLNDINNQISSAQSRLNDYNSALSALIQRKNELTQQRSSIENKRAPESAISTLEQRYSSCSSQASSIRNEYSGYVSSIQRNSDQIITLRNNAADAPRQISLVNQQISSVDSTIADLENQLRDARARRSTLESDRSRYSNLIQSANDQISRLESQNNGLRSQASGVQSKVDSQLVECNAYKREADKIRTDISSSQSDYEVVNRQITVQEGLISSKQNEINRLTSQINGYPIRKSPLQASLQNTQSALDRQYSICSQSAGALTNAQNDLQAATLKFDTQNKFLQEARTKLPSAQAQKDAADAEVNRILRSVSTVPTASTTIRISTSPVTVANFGAPVTVNIVDYMSRNYGEGNRRYWQPYVKVGTPVSIMYPVSQTTWSALRGSSSGGVFLPRSGGFSASGLGSFTCGGGAATSGYGRITSVQPGYFTVQGPTKEIYNLRVGGCSRLEANRPEYVASVYDNVFFKGVRSGNEYQVHDLTCLN